MNKPKLLHGIVALMALTLCGVSCAMLHDIGGSQKRLEAALNQEGWKLTHILLVDQYLDTEGTMVVEAAMHCPAWAGQLRFRMLGSRVTVQDMRENKIVGEKEKRQLVPGSPQALHLAKALTEFIPQHHGRDAVNATLLKEVLCGSRKVADREWWKSWVKRPGG